VLHQTWQKVKGRPRLYRRLLPLVQAGAHAIQGVRRAAGFCAAPVRFGLHWMLPSPGIGQVPRSAADGTRTIVMLVVSNLPVDPRVRREAQALAAAGWCVRILCPLPPGVPPGLDLDWGPGIEVRWLPEHSGLFAYRYPCFLGSSLLRAALRERPFAFHAHDLSTTLVALTAAHRTGAQAVCDFHEWISENVTFDPATARYRAHRPYVAATYRHLERLAVRRASATITVGEGIAAELDQLAGCGPRVHVVRNIPSFSARPSRTYASLRQTLAIPPGQTLVLYQGGIGPSRHLEPVIRALALAPHVALAIRGPEIEHYARHYRDVAAAAGGGAASRLHILDAVPSTDVVAAAAGADAGIYTVAGLCRSFTLAMPNKVFEYMHAGLPVLAADYPEVRRLVSAHGVGLLFDPDAPASIAAAMSRLADEPELGASIAARIPMALADLGAADEWQRLVAIYDRLGSRGAGCVNGHEAPIGRTLLAPMAAGDEGSAG